MLILTRRIGEVLMLGEDISLRVLSVVDGHVRIGIIAPSDVAVDRLEVRQRRLSRADAEALQQKCPVVLTE